MTMLEAGNLWINEMKSSGRAEQTIKTYQARIKHLLTSSVIHKDTKEITKQDIDSVINGMVNQGYKTSTIKSTYDTISGFCHWMCKNEWIDNLDIVDIQYPEVVSYEPIILDASQVKKVMSLAYGTELYLPVSISALTGLRRNQVLGLLWNDVLWEDSLLVVNKSLIRSKRRIFSAGKERKARIIPIVPELLEILNVAYQSRLKSKDVAELSDDYICKTVTGLCFESTYFDKRFRKFVIDNQLPNQLRFHDLRWSYINNMVRLIGPKETANLVGHHSTVYCLDYYYKVDDCA